MLLLQRRRRSATNTKDAIAAVGGRKTDERAGQVDR